MSNLERALRELESATAAVASVHVEDFAEAKAAIDRRYWAITDVMELVSAPPALPAGECETALRRLKLAEEAGAKAMRRLSGARNAVIAEWNQWSRIYRTLGSTGASESSHIDFRG